MALTIPLLVMLAILASAWVVGILARTRDVGFMKIAGTIGVIGVLALPVLYDAWLFDGTCIDKLGTTAPCTLAERLWSSLQLGFAFTVPPAILWIVAFVTSARMGTR
jgi:hypothetical protein